MMNRIWQIDSKTKFAMRLPMARTERTNERTNERVQDQGENHQVPDAVGAVDEFVVPIGEALADLDVTTPRPLADVLNWMPRWKIPRWMRQAIGDRDAWTCWICGRPGDVLDHLEPRSSFLPEHIVGDDQFGDEWPDCGRTPAWCASCGGTRMVPESWIWEWSA